MNLRNGACPLRKELPPWLLRVLLDATKERRARVQGQSSSSERWRKRRRTGTRSRAGWDPRMGRRAGVQLPVLPRAAAAAEQGGSVPASAGSHVSAQTCEQEKWLLLTFLICV